ncbi:MAG: TldD/PmbA family protein, partial [Candidatus Bipolaricaulota bacterium]|nr:TldD/PmbA family protein [Candidatus Bipolaricaulota bacterium]
VEFESRGTKKEDANVLGEKRLAEIAQRVLRESKAEQTEVMITSNDAYLTRFATNTVHQNVAELDATIRVRVITDQKTGVATGNDLTDAGLKKLVRTAERIASFQQKNPDSSFLPKPQPIRPVNAYVDATAKCTPLDRAKGVEKILAPSRKNGLDAAGAFSTEEQEILIANSLGVSAYHRGTAASIMTVIMGTDSSGYASDESIDVSRLDPAAIGKTAIDKALQSRNPTSVEPGEYTVVLEEDAVANMVLFLAFMGMSALAVQEGRSFMNGKFGERITGGEITIWDDGFDSRGLPQPFDFEGTPKQKVMLIEKGIAKNVVYDSSTAAKEPGKTSTGHSLPAPNTQGPLPLNLFMAAGKATKEEMIASTDRGILVTRFHYANILHPVKTVLTGMTRDGTFLIEKGKIVRPIKNLRFTQSLLEAFANVDMLGSQPKLAKAYGIPTCVPAAKIRNFRFTGGTE